MWRSQCTVHWYFKQQFRGEFQLEFLKTSAAIRSTDKIQTENMTNNKDTGRKNRRFSIFQLLQLKQMPDDRRILEEF